LLLSDDCCKEKTVGGKQYVQVPGTTLGFTCDGDCVYEEVGNPEYLTCFKAESGGLTVTCTESTVDSMFTFISRKNDEIVFNVWDETVQCTLEPTTGDTDQEIDCSLVKTTTDGFTPESKQSSLFFSSTSDGIPEWISLHTSDKEFIHCFKSESCRSNCLTFNNNNIPSCLCCVAVAYSHVLEGPGLPNMLYVEGSFNVTGNLNEAQNKCRDKCNNDGCKFWTLSFHDDNKGHEDEHQHSHSRNHRGVSECGLRYYDASARLETNPDQYVAKAGNNSTIYSNQTFVWKILKDVKNDKECGDQCKKNTECTTWTFDKENGRCSLNNYQPTRVINIARYMPKPNLVSGCIPRVNSTCPLTPDN